MAEIFKIGENLLFYHNSASFDFFCILVFDLSSFLLGHIFHRRKVFLAFKMAAISKEHNFNIFPRIFLYSY
jgi:hypothetical protein